MSKKDYYYNLALLESESSTHDHNHGCLIVKGGKVLFKSANINYQHAEERVLRRCLLYGLQS